MILDDFDSRPGSATSLLRTIIGSYLRGLGGWIPVSELIRLMAAVDVNGAHARTAIARVKAKGLVYPERRDGVYGYRLNLEAIPMLERGDRRIFMPRQQRDGGPWCLISFSLPESQRAVRHQLRKRLAWIGCGTVATGLWICPAFLTDEVEEILDDLGVRDAATLFITDTPQTNVSLSAAVCRWWDLDRLARLHEDFIRKFSDIEPTDDACVDFGSYMKALDGWRIIPYLDPGLQRKALPEDWPGTESVALFDRLKWDLAPTAQHYVNEMAGIR